MLYGIFQSIFLHVTHVTTHDYFIIETYSFTVQNRQLMWQIFAKNIISMAIGIINLERLSPNFIADTMNWFLNSVLD